MQSTTMILALFGAASVSAFQAPPMTRVELRAPLDVAAGRSSVAIQATAAKEDNMVMPWLKRMSSPSGKGKYGEVITYDEIRAALRTWCDGIIEIGQVYTDGGDFRAKAMEMIEANYAFTHDLGKGNQLLFKPTKAAEHPFRSTFEEFLSYFVGDGQYSEDTGFAITPWTKIRFDMHGVYINSEAATVMGNYYFTNVEGSETKVEYTFQMVRVKVPDGKLKIVLQHSSLPFSP